MYDVTVTVQVVETGHISVSTVYGVSPDKLLEVFSDFMRPIGPRFRLLSFIALFSSDEPA